MNLAKSNLILAGAAVVLAIPTTFTLLGEREFFADISERTNMFDGFTDANVAQIVLGVPKDPQPEPPPNANPNQEQPIQYDQIVFQRTDNGFVLGQGMGVLTGAPANPEMIDHHVFNQLRDIPGDAESLMIEDATEEQLAKYDLDDETAFIMQCVNQQGQPVARLLVGRDSKRGSKESVSGIFVREFDSNDIVLCEDLTYWQRDIKPDLWLDKLILRQEQDEAKRFTISRVAIRNSHTGEKPIVFIRPPGQGSWTVENPPADRGAPRQEEIERFMQVFNYLGLSQYLGPKQGKNLAGMGLYPGDLEIDVTYEKDGTEENLRLVSGQPVDDKNENYLLVNDSPFLNTWANYQVNRFERNFDDLFDPAPGQAEDNPEDGKKDDGAKGLKAKPLIKDEPVKKAPAKKTPVKKTPVKKTPVKKAGG